MIFRPQVAQSGLLTQLKRTLKDVIATIRTKFHSRVRQYSVGTMVAACLISCLPTEALAGCGRWDIGCKFREAISRIRQARIEEELRRRAEEAARQAAEIARQAAEEARKAAEALARLAQDNGINPKLEARGIKMFEAKCLSRTDGRTFFYKGGCFNLIERGQIAEHEGFINDIEDELGEYLFTRTLEEWIKKAVPKLTGISGAGETDFVTFFSQFKSLGNRKLNQQLTDDYKYYIDSAINTGGELHNLIYGRQQKLIPNDGDLMPIKFATVIPRIGKADISSNFYDSLIPPPPSIDRYKTIPAVIAGYSVPIQLAVIGRRPVYGVPASAQVRIGFPLAYGGVVMPRNDPTKAPTRSLWNSVGDQGWGANGKDQEGYFFVTVQLEAGLGIAPMDGPDAFSAFDLAGEFTTVLKCPVKLGDCQVRNISVQGAVDISLDAFRSLRALMKAFNNTAVRMGLRAAEPAIEDVAEVALGRGPSEAMFATMNMILQEDATEIALEGSQSVVQTAEGELIDPMGVYNLNSNDFFGRTIEPDFRPSATPVDVSNVVRARGSCGGFAKDRYNWVDSAIGFEGVVSQGVSVTCYVKRPLVEFALGVSWINPDVFEKTFIPGYKIHSDSSPDVLNALLVVANSSGVDLNYGDADNPEAQSITLRARAFPHAYTGLQWPLTTNGGKGLPFIHE